MLYMLRSCVSQPYICHTLASCNNNSAVARNGSTCTSRFRDVLSVRAPARNLDSRNYSIPKEGVPAGKSVIQRRLPRSSRHWPSTKRSFSSRQSLGSHS
jgi:hypothetical protein